MQQKKTILALIPHNPGINNLVKILAPNWLTPNFTQKSQIKLVTCEISKDWPTDHKGDYCKDAIEYTGQKYVNDNTISER